jgi:hypothetical protein
MIKSMSRKIKLALAREEAATVFTPAAGRRLQSSGESAGGAAFADDAEADVV